MDIYRWPLPTGAGHRRRHQSSECSSGQNLDADWAPDGRGHRVCLTTRRGAVFAALDGPRRAGISRPVASVSSFPTRMESTTLAGLPMVCTSSSMRAPDTTTGWRFCPRGDGTMRELSPATSWMVPQWSDTGERLYGAAGRSASFAIRVRDVSSGHESELAWPVNMMLRRLPRRAVAGTWKSERWSAGHRRTSSGWRRVASGADGGGRRSGVHDRLVAGRHDAVRVAPDWPRHGPRRNGDLVHPGHQRCPGASLSSWRNPRDGRRKKIQTEPGWP